MVRVRVRVWVKVRVRVRVELGLGVRQIFVLLEHARTHVYAVFSALSSRLCLLGFVVVALSYWLFLRFHCDGSFDVFLTIGRLFLINLNPSPNPNPSYWPSYVDRTVAIELSHFMWRNPRPQP